MHTYTAPKSTSELQAQCFDTVGWVILPAKTVPEMTYNVFSGTLNPTHSLTHASSQL